MKRIIVVFLATVLLLSVFAGCEQPDIKPDENPSESGQNSENTYEEEIDDASESTEHSSIEETNTSESTLSSDYETNSRESPSETNQESENTYEEEMDDITESAQNSSAEETQSVQEAPTNGSEQQENDKSIDNSIQTKQYQYFYRSVEENPYDKWLKNELEKGERAEKTIYAEYLAYWKDELVFTIESGEVIFDDKEQYEQWKSDIQQWLVISQNILKNEMNMMNYSLGQLEVIIPYCEMVRQKAIDAKRFIYFYQIYNTLTPYTNIEINWCSQ